MKKSITHQIIRTESATLTQSEKEKFEDNKNYQLFLAICSYIIIVWLCIYIWNKGYQSTNIDDKSYRVFFSDSDNEGFKAAMPFVSAIVFIGITFIFVKFIIQSIIPLNKALNNGIKSLVFFIPTKIFSPDSNKYYLPLPLTKQEKIEISKEIFESINENEELCLEILPGINIILHLSKDGKEIKYN